MNEQVWWYATRAAGLMTWSTAVAAVIVGLMLSTRMIRARTGPWTLDLHRFLGGLTLVFLAAHLATLWADSYVEFGWRELLIPGASSWRPQAVAWGVIAAWILVAVEITSLLRNRISQLVWRVVHWMSLLVVAAGTVHAVQAGSDVDNPLVWVAAAAGSVAIIALGAMRLRNDGVKQKTAHQPKPESEILLEMRQRLADMPVPEARSRVEFVTEATTELPQRSGDFLEEHDGAESGALLEALGRAVRAEEPVEGPDDDGGSPFPAAAFLSAHVEGPEPVGAAEEIGTWVEKSPDDPFAAANRTDLPHDPQPFVEAAAPAPPLPPPPPPEPVTAEPMAFEPVAAEIPPPAPPPLPLRPLRRVEPIRQPEQPFADASQAAEAPAPPPVAAAPAPSPSGPPDAMVAVAPPPLPLQVDPETGEPDEEAYRAWLVEWLSYAEQYGDEAPVDPDRA